ncbi:HAMP domain-containing histidine kinase [Methylobacterium sp. BTF04]|uniref:sensor histidine kinase n=1 Tax=Methylobacterium sp. BTF04 TaxID=2708300 RepID=UPI0013D26130|nr:HAMP domain-containing sensor histidine kinase [Methylobacterium sp. BTF04]NEU14093.1 HAMP domain-containing histidine kinase [Methylobacterium sp. BTF04]
MARVGLLGRIMLLLLGALSVLVLATVALDRWQRRQEHSPYATRFPRLEQTAGIMTLLRDADAGQRTAILRAVSGEALKAEITDAPLLESGLIREPRLEARLHRMVGDSDGRIRAFTDSDMLRRGVDPAEVEQSDTHWPLGRLATATYDLPDGRTLIVSAFAHHRSLMPWLLGQPLSLWVAVLGAAVAGLVLVGTRHELIPLRRLTEAVSRFDGRAPEAVVTTHGAPEIRRLSRAVQAMQERIAGLIGERSLLIGAISHDLKTFLTRLRLRAEGVSEPERRGRLIADLDGMTALIETSLSFARGTAVEVGRRAVDIADLVAVEVAEHAAQGTPISLSGEDVEDAVVAGDAVALRRVVANLIENAVKFGQSSILVAVRRAGTVCQVVVEDDGPGIPASERSAVFSPYYRIEGSRNRQTGGTGLGLAIARQIAEAHGGSVVAEAASLGGARLVVTLPAIS